MEKINKIYVSEGCTCWAYDINDKPLMDYNSDEQRDILHQLVDMLTNDETYRIAQEAMKSVCEEHGENKYDDEPCECCGDYVVTWSYNIEEDE